MVFQYSWHAKRSRKNASCDDCADWREVYDASMVLAQLLGSVSQAAFMQEHFLRLPFALAGGCADFCHCGDWRAASRILSSPGADVIVGSAKQRYDGPLPK